MLFCPAPVKFMPNGTLYPVTLVALYTQLVGGVPVDVSLKNIVYGATPDQLMNEEAVVVWPGAGVAVKLAAGADVTLIHVT